MFVFECIWYDLVCYTDHARAKYTHAHIPYPTSRQHVLNAVSPPVAYSHAVASAGCGSGSAEMLETTNMSTRGKKAWRLAELRMVCPKQRWVSGECGVCVVVYGVYFRCEEV